jgi:hypothetical protein
VVLEQNVSNFVLSAKSKASNTPMVRVEVKSAFSSSLLNVPRQKNKGKKKRMVNTNVKISEKDSNEVKTLYI